MMDFVSKLVAEILGAFAPLAEALENEDSLAALLTEFGWQLGNAATLAEFEGAKSNIRDSFNSGTNAAKGVLEVLDADKTPETDGVNTVFFSTGGLLAGRALPGRRRRCWRQSGRW